ncbi:MAG TPA: type II toxin-antitoxin system VapC family toxin [Chloroflexota bacterium]|nr:type II toxin-antitoxin system VapC family toxin [Chloroflexota bacterium]
MRDRPPPAEIYLDTSIFVAAIVRTAPHRTACTSFCQRLIAADSQIYFSQFVRLELLQALRRLATTQHNIAPAVRAQYGLDRWGDDPVVRRNWLEAGTAQFAALLARFRAAVELPWSASMWRATMGIMIRHGLQAQDALHVATAQEWGLHALAAVDADYRRVPALDFWLIRD